MTRGIVTAREQVELLSPLLREAIVKVARYPQEWRGGDAPYGRFESTGRARNRPPSVLRDLNDPDAGILDPSEIEYRQVGSSVSAYHPNGEKLGNYSWEGHGGQPHIGVAQVKPEYQGQGVGGGIIDYIREHHEPELAHSGYQRQGSLSYQGRAGALRDLGNTEEEHNDYFNTTPYNYNQSSPASFDSSYTKTDAQQRAHNELMQQFEEDQKHPNYSGYVSDSDGNDYDPDMYDEYGDSHEYGYDSNGNYVGLYDGGKDSEGYSEEGYNSAGYDREGLDQSGHDEEGYDEDGFHQDTELDREGRTRHGYTPGNGEAPEGTVPMSEMASHWAQNGLPTSPEHQEMMDDAAAGIGQEMYAVRQLQRSPHTGDYHIGNGDTVYSSLDRARQMAYHPDDPSKDKDIVSADYLEPDALHTDASGKTPDDFHYAPASDSYDAEDTASTRASIVHDPQRHQRILGDLGHGWSQGTLPHSSQPSMEYTNGHSGRGGRMWQQGNGLWRTEHQPEFGSPKRGQHNNYRDAANAITEGTMPGPDMEQHAMEINNDYRATGRGTVDWEPHPNGQGLTARTPHGDLHVVQNPDTGTWNHHAGPHGFQPGDEGGIRDMLSGGTTRNRAAERGIQAITNRPFHAGPGKAGGESGPLRNK